MKSEMVEENREPCLWLNGAQDILFFSTVLARLLILKEHVMFVACVHVVSIGILKGTVLLSILTG